MSDRLKNDGRYALTRRAEPDDLEDQVKALKELQRQPGFIAGKLVPKAKHNKSSFNAGSLIRGIRRLVAVIKVKSKIQS